MARSLGPLSKTIFKTANDRLCLLPSRRDAVSARAAPFLLASLLNMADSKTADSDKLAAGMVHPNPCSVLGEQCPPGANSQPAGATRPVHLHPNLTAVTSPVSGGGSLELTAAQRQQCPAEQGWYGG